jgi:hypothetical protein
LLAASEGKAEAGAIREPAGAVHRRESDMAPGLVGDRGPTAMATQTKAGQPLRSDGEREKKADLHGGSPFEMFA